MKEAQITVITTGGTIDKVYFDANSTFEVGSSVVGELLSQAHVSVPVEVVELMRKDSLELTDDDRDSIAEAVIQAETTSIVITHGTDTMTHTAQRLQQIKDKTVVLTGSFSPARFALTDAIFNVGLAFGAAQSKPAGVYIAMSGQVFPGTGVVKNKQTMAFEPTSASRDSQG